MARVGRQLWATLEPLLPAIAKQPADEAKKMDAPPPADGSAGASKAARAVVEGALPGVKKAVESATRIAAERTDKHSRREFARLGIKLGDADPGIAKLVPQWRKENVARVTGMLEDQLGKIERILEEGDGHYADTLAKEIQRQCEDVSDSRATLIATDQALTLNAQITAQRQQDAGIEEYVWTTSNDERVRDEHEALEGEVFSWESGGDPTEGHPGEAVLCRCTAFPILPELTEE